MGELKAEAHKEHRLNKTTRGTLSETHGIQVKTEIEGRQSQATGQK